MKFFKGVCKCGHIIEPPAEQVGEMVRQTVKAFGSGSLPPGALDSVSVGAVTGEWVMHSEMIGGDHSALTVTSEPVVTKVEV